MPSNNTKQYVYDFTIIYRSNSIDNVEDVERVFQKVADDDADLKAKCINIVSGAGGTMASLAETRLSTSVLHRLPHPKAARSATESVSQTVANGPTVIVVPVTTAIDPRSIQPV